LVIAKPNRGELLATKELDACVKIFAWLVVIDLVLLSWPIVAVS
jgi:hypothetical protein